MALLEPAFEFPIVLDNADTDGGRMRQLHRQLRAAILDKRLPPGAELPATRRVAAACGVARNTVIAAYDLLIAEGYVVPRRGARAVVADVAARRPSKARRFAGSQADACINPLWNMGELQADAPRQLPPRSFRLGVPEHEGFPHEVWRRLSAQSLRAWSRVPFGYAPTQGIAELRQAIAQHVAFARAVACSADDVVVTSGAQQAFDLLARLLVVAKQTRVAVEDPGYPPLRAAFVAAGALLVPVPVDGEGLRVDELPHDARVVVVTPSHQSPTGVTLSLRRRQALLEFARARGAVVIEDDYDGEFRFGPRPLDALQTLDRDAVVFYVGTFSKSLFPSLRKGFVVTPPWARQALITVKHCADSHCDTITQSVLAAFIRDGHLARHVRRMRAQYAQRREALLGALTGPLAPWFEPIRSEAGLHLAACIRDSAQAASVIAQTKLHAPGAQSIAEYACSLASRPAVAFGYGTIGAEAISVALAGLAKALRRHAS